MINFKSIYCQNFMSVGNDGIEIDLSGEESVLVTGKNGSGKSCMLTDGFCFGLFGKPFRHVKLAQLVNSINEKKTLVVIKFDIGKSQYKVVRGLRPAIFEIWKDGNLIPQDASAKDYQARFEENILKLDFKSFTQIVILGSASFVPFMQLPIGQRRLLIENILDISIFSDMNTVLKGRRSDLLTDITEKRHKFDLKKQAYDLYKEHHDKANEALASQKKRITEDIDTEQERLLVLHKEVAVLDSRIKNKETINAKVDALSNNLKELMRLSIQIRQNKKSVETREKFLNENDSCTVCGQNIAGDYKEKESSSIGTKKRELQIGIEVLSTKAKDLKGEKEGFDEKKEQIKMDETLIDSKNDTIGDSIRLISRLEISLKDLKEPVKNNQDKLNELAEEIKLISSVIVKYLDKRRLYDIIGTYLKDDGIKTKIVAHYLPIINSFVNKYMEALNFPVNFMFDVNFKETIRSRYRDEFSYSSFSEGEKARINLSLLFMLRDISIAKNRNATNILLFDEILDSSLDGQGMGDFLGILGELCDGTKPIIISHREGVSDGFGKTLTFSKEGNFTKLKEN